MTSSFVMAVRLSMRLHGTNPLTIRMFKKLDKNVF